MTRAFLALALVALAAAPARADTTMFTLSPAWQKIAAAGQGVDVQNLSAAGYAVLSTGMTAAPAGTAGQALGPGEHRLYSLGADLYAFGSGTLTVTSGFGGGAVLQSGSTGVDGSANAAAVPMAGLVLLTTIPATPGRAFVEVQNQSAGTVQLVRDDGAGNNLTSILLGAGAGAGAQGAGWSSATFKGRVRVYGTTGAEIAAYQD